jgi:cytidylate kinase
VEFDMIVAIDGPSGVGKSTIARAVAGARGMHYLDTGATYRAATVAVLDAGIDPEDGPAVVERSKTMNVGYEHGTVTLDGSDVTARVRDADVTGAVSAVSAQAELRRTIVEMQREWVAQHDNIAVVEGRDIGSVVFPDAAVKIFLTADPEVRAARRAGDPEAGGATAAAVAADLARRDRYDSNRAASPLIAADDAHIVDTSHLTIEQVVEEVLRLVDVELNRPKAL